VPETEILKLLVDAGASGVIIVMLWDMRREQRETNKQIWTLLEYLVRRDDELIARGKTLRKSKPVSWRQL